MNALSSDPLETTPHFPHTLLKHLNLLHEGLVSLPLNGFVLVGVTAWHGRSPLVVSVLWQEMEP